MTTVAPARTSRVVNNLNRLSRARGARLRFGVLAFAVVTAVTYRIARYEAFTGFLGPDESMMLLWLKSFLDSGWHYVGANNFGPFWYQFWGSVFSFFEIPVNLDCGRAVTMVVWILTSLVLGLATWRMTRSIILGLVTQLGAFADLRTLPLSSIHPNGIVVLLLAAIVALSCLVRGRTSPWPMALLGGTAAALTLVKINIGIIALIAVALVCAISYPGFAQRRWLRPLIEIGFVVLPLLLMRSRLLDTAVVRHFALHVCAAALAVVIALRVRHVSQRDSKELWWLGVGIVAVGVTILLVVLAAGTDPSQLFDGLIKFPLLVRDVVVLYWPLVLPEPSYILDLLPLAGVLGYWYLVRNRKVRLNTAWIWLVWGLSIAVGLLMAYPMIWSIALNTDYTRSMPYTIRWSLLSFVWVALIPPPGPPDEDTQFARLLLPPLAVLVQLYNYPVGGSHLWCSTLLLIPVGALCIANGVRWITFGLNSNSPAEPRTRLAIRLIAPAIVMAILVSNVAVRLPQELNRARADYEDGVSLGLPGSEEIHLEAPTAAPANFQAIVAAINENCNSFVTVGALNFFYLWTGQEPPAGFSVISALFLVDQEAEVEAIRSIDGLCLVTRTGVVTSPNASKARPGPLVAFLHQGFVPIAKFKDYDLLKRKR
jgi:hypothetical protein